MPDAASVKVMELLNEVIDEIEQSRKALFASRKTIDIDYVLDILREIRAALPQDLRQAQQILDQRQNILDEAQELAGDMVEEARQRIDETVVNHEVLQLAYAKSDEILEDAKRRAFELRVSADDYALSVLDDLAGYIKEYSKIVAENKSNFENRLRRQNDDMIP